MSRLVSRATPLQAGMIVSNEPGYYKAGAYGIRIENLVAVREAKIEGADRRYFEFETLTLAPIDTRLIDLALLKGIRVDPVRRRDARTVHQRL